jgi:hypothetical protein
VGRRVRSNLWSDVTGLRTGPSAKTRPRWVPHCPPCPQSTYVWLLASPYLLNSAAFLWPARARTPPPPTSPRPSWCSADSARSRGTRRAGSRARTPRGSTTGCTRAGARSARSWYVRVPCYPPCQDTTWEYDWVYESWRSLGSQLVCAGPLLPSAKRSSATLGKVAHTLHERYAACLSHYLALAHAQKGEEPAPGEKNRGKRPKRPHPSPGSSRTAAADRMR